jgi:hypothetical protein
MAEKTGRDLITPDDLGGRVDAAQELLNYSTLKIGTKFPMSSHDKILSVPFQGGRSCLVL